MIFIDLFSPGGIGDGQVTHVGMVEYIEEMVVALVQGNGEPDPTVVTPTRKSTAPGIIRQRLEIFGHPLVVPATVPISGITALQAVRDHGAVEDGQIAAGGLYATLTSAGAIVPRNSGHPF